MLIALKIDRSVDLSKFRDLLLGLQIPHRINEDGEQQVIWVADEAGATKVKETWQAHTEGRINYTAVDEFSKQQAESRPASSFLFELLRAPLTLTLVVACLVCYPITWGVESQNFNEWFGLFSFTEFDIYGDKIYFSDLNHTLTSGQYWRLVSPMFLHFGVMHLVFNLCWLLDLGRRIESENGKTTLLLLVLATATFSHLLNYWLVGVGFIGGMSGVVYGLVGFCLAWQKLVPSRLHGVPPIVYGFLLVSLGLGFSGVMDAVFQVNIANWAHLGGLVAGLLVGLIAGSYARYRQVAV